MFNKNKTTLTIDHQIGQTYRIGYNLTYIPEFAFVIQGFLLQVIKEQLLDNDT